MFEQKLFMQSVRFIMCISNEIIEILYSNDCELIPNEKQINFH